MFLTLNINLLPLVYTPAPLSQSLPSQAPSLNELRKDFESRYIPSGAMIPTLQVNDKIIVDKHTYRSTPPQRGDLILFNPPPVLQQQNFKEAFIKRIIGLPGETVQIKAGRVYINQKALSENYIAEPPQYEYGPVQIPNNSYFVLGDNRNNSYDSHYWGFVDREFIFGKAIAIYCPLQRQRVLDSQPLNPKNKAFVEQMLPTFKNFPSLCNMQPLS